MITLILGTQDEDSRVSHILEEHGRQLKPLVATQRGTFLEFCRRVVRSVQTLTVSDDGRGNIYRVVANDPFSVLFPLEYLEEAFEKGTALLKMATAIETALDLGLKIQIISVDEVLFGRLGEFWPRHWPEIKLFTGKEGAPE